MRRTLMLVLLSFFLVVFTGSVFHFPIRWADQNRDMPFDFADTDFDDATRVTISKTGYDLKKLYLMASLPYIDGAVNSLCSLYVYADSSTTKAAADSCILWGTGFESPGYFMEFPQDMDNVVIVNISGVNGYLHHYALWGAE